MECVNYIHFHTPFYLSIAEPNLFVTGDVLRSWSKKWSLTDHGLRESISAHILFTRHVKGGRRRGRAEEENKLTDIGWTLHGSCQTKISARLFFSAKVNWGWNGLSLHFSAHKSSSSPNLKNSHPADQVGFEMFPYVYTSHRAQINQAKMLSFHLTGPLGLCVP